MVSLESQSGMDPYNGIVTEPHYSDEARRFADIVNGYSTWIKWEEREHYWIAVRLSDGGTDGELYHSKRDAVRGQTDEFLCCYFAFRNCMNGISYKEAEAFMLYVRGAYKAGLRLPDPDDQFGGPDPFMPVSQFDRLRKIVNGNLIKATN